MFLTTLASLLVLGTAFSTPTLTTATATTATTPTLWLTNHSSTVKSIVPLVLDISPLVVTGAQFTSDECVSALHADTGKLFWSSTVLAEWTYGVAVQPDQGANGGSRGVAAFGCPFDPGTAPISPCELGFFKDVTDGTLAWKIAIPGAEVGASAGPPSVAFTPDGESIVVTFVDRNSTSNPGAEFMAVVSVANPKATPSRATLGAGTGHGLHLATGKTSDSTVRALLSRHDATSNTDLHVDVQFAGAGAPITVAPDPSIDCNGTSVCGWMASSPDLSTVIVDARPATMSGSVCPYQPQNPLMWGFALLTRNGARAQAARYSTAWAKCSGASNAKVMTSLHLASSGAQIITSFVHVDPNTSSVVAAEVCAFDAARGDESWCTPLYEVDPPLSSPSALVPSVATLSEDDRLVFSLASVGLLHVDASPRNGAPQKIGLLYGRDGVDDCCAPTAVTVADDFLVASIPYGTQSGIWCNCRGSRLFGLKLPSAA